MRRLELSSHLRLFLRVEPMSPLLFRRSHFFASQDVFEWHCRHPRGFRSVLEVVLPYMWNMAQWSRRGRRGLWSRTWLEFRVAQVARHDLRKSRGLKAWYFDWDGHEEAAILIGDGIRWKGSSCKVDYGFCWSAAVRRDSCFPEQVSCVAKALLNAVNLKLWWLALSSVQVWISVRKQHWSTLTSTCGIS